MPAISCFLSGIDMISEIAVPTAGGVVRYPPGATLGPRVMWDYEFVWIVSGRCVLDINEREYPAPPDSFFLIRPGQRVFFEWDRRQTTVHGFVHFTLNKKIPGLGDPEQWPQVLYLDQLEDILRPLLRYAAGIAGGTDPALKMLKTVNLLHALIVYVNSWFRYGAVALPFVNSIIGELYRTIGKLLDGPQADRITLPKLAKCVKVTPEYLCRLTRQVLHFTPMELVFRLRIEKACNLLARTDLPIKQISELTGFSNVFHFSRRFKHQTQTTPARYRRLAYIGKAVPYSQIIPVCATLNETSDTMS
jgi:AraC family transcriptional regulator